jgi:putative flavoprotein involved in K+ transport
MVWWALEVGFLDQTVEDLPSPDARLWANVLGTGHGGGHDLNLRTLRAAGVTLTGHFLDADLSRVRFADDLGDSVAWGDERYRQFREMVRATVTERALEMPDLPDPEPLDMKGPLEIELSRLGAVVFAGGFRPDYARWIDVPGAFDPLGFPIQTDGESAVARGLFFVGTHFLRTRKSSILAGVGEDAAIVAERIATSRR